MAVARQGVWSHSAGLVSAIAKQLKLVNFKPVAKITVKFDPFEERVKHARDLFYYISASKIAKTNPFCQLKADVVCDRSEPTVTCNLLSGEKIIFKLGNLDALDVLKLYNKHVSSLVPEEVVEEKGKPKKKLKKNIKIRIPRRRR
ncbi:uncharacterized protein mRpL53 [Venturia canescens]|uniref:uncharacterized protein mRpL53 n=1 Tax=Venturia canescens TaxID=32260 RepID=UPI001C9C7E11|nr:uncharacterized protein LOC122416410 [Venturia canescens]